MTDRKWARASAMLVGFCAAFLVYLFGVRLEWWQRLFDEDYSVVVGLLILGAGYVIRSNLSKHKPVEKPE